MPLTAVRRKQPTLFPIDDEPVAVGGVVLWFRAGPWEKWRVVGRAEALASALELIDGCGDWYPAQDRRDPNH